jgi:hypothetical protein
MAVEVTTVGCLVENPLKPEWGPGKVAHARGDTLFVFFRDLPGERARRFRADALRLAASQSDPILDNLPPFVEKDSDILISAARITPAQAREQFLRHYPQGFTDAAYIGTESERERTYKWAAHERFVENFGGGRGRALLTSDEADLVGEISRVLGSASNLLATQEYIALREGLRNREAARRYLSTLLDLVEAGPQEAPFLAHAEATASLPAKGQTHTDKWTVATVLPYLARPEAFNFVKPTPTQAAAAALGFDIRYDPRPNWDTYERVLRMSQLYMDQLADLRPRDFIDVQSFFWVTGGSFEQTLAAHKAKREARAGH